MVGAIIIALALQGAGGNLVANGDFSNVAGGAPVGWEAAGNRDHVRQSLTATTDDGRPCARLTCTGFTGSGPDDHAMIAQVRQVRLEAGHTYEFSCRAKENGMRSGAVEVAVSDMSVWDNCGLDFGLEVGPTWRTYRCFFRATRSVHEQSRLQFWFTEAGDFYLSDVRIVEAELPHARFTNTAAAGQGRNLTPNGGFELGAAGWSSTGTEVGWGNDFAELQGQVTASSDPERPQFLRIPVGGAHSVELGSDYPRAVMQPQTRPLAASRGWIEVVPNQPYTLSCDLRSSLDHGRAVLGYIGMDAETGVESTRREERAVDVGTVWSRYTFTFRPVRRFLYVTVGPDEPDGQPMNLDVARVQLESGDRASAYEPFAETEVAVTASAPGGIFSAGERGTLVVRRSPGPSPIQVELMATDTFGRQIPLASPILVRETTTVPIPPGWRGWFSVHATTHDKRVSVITPDVRIAVTPGPAPTESVLGINHAFADPALIDLARKVGVSMYRDWSLKWNQTEPAEGRFDWPAEDAQIDRVLQRGAGVIALLPPFPSAEWSSSAPASLAPSSDMGDMVRQSWAPKDPADLARFAGAVVEHFKQRVHVWEFLNEPIYTSYSLPRPRYGPADYVELLHTTAAAIRKADPTCRIIGGSASDPGRLTEEMFDAGLLDDIDILNLHMYPGLAKPESYLPAMVDLNERMKRHGHVRPIWITEFSYYGIDTPPREPYVPSGGSWGESRLLEDERRCAEFTVRFMAIMLEQGVQKVFIHAGTNAAPNFPETECCLFGEDGAPRKVACALANLCARLGAHPVPDGWSASPAGETVMRFRVGGRHVAVAWSTGAPVERPRPAGVRAFDMVGNEVAGKSIRLTESPVYEVGR